MTRKIILALLLCVLLAALYGCAAPQSFPTPQQQAPNYNADPTDTPEPAPTDEPEYEGNPLDEEDEGEYTTIEQSQELASVYAHAGSTPMPLDPIDMPTPTPKPELTFSYQTYEATKLGLKFDGPTGWEVNSTPSDSFTITEPADQQKDNYSAFITVHRASVNKQYNSSELAKEVKDMLDTIGSSNFKEFKPSYTDKRTLMDQEGAYANYESTMVDGTRVRGRVHVTCIDKVLYSIHLSHPAGYNTSYLKNYQKIRDTMALTK